jgi:response regulator RpfG family c-di-GMP phosphodiesterase
MKKQVLLVSRLNDESNVIKKDFLKTNQFYVEQASTSTQAIERISSQKVDLIVLNMDTFTPKRIKLATDLKNLGYNFPLLLLAKTVLPESLKSLGNLPSAALLEKPYEVRDLAGISEKLLEGRQCKQRIFRRYMTDEVAHLEIFNKTGENIPSRVRNLSKGGAFLEYTGMPINVGDILRVAIDLKEVDKSYDLNGRVVWSTTVSPWGSDPGIGIEFIPSKYVYSNLLRKM